MKPTTNSWRVDETSIKVKKEWVYLYRAVNSQRNTLDFFFSPTRDAQAAKQFFLKTLAASHTREPRVINVDKNAAYPKAMTDLKATGILPEKVELRQVKYLNNLIEQDHCLPVPPPPAPAPSRTFHGPTENLKFAIFICLRYRFSFINAVCIAANLLGIIPTADLNDRLNKWMLENPTSSAISVKLSLPSTILFFACSIRICVTYL